MILSFFFTLLNIYGWFWWRRITQRVLIREACVHVIAVRQFMDKSTFQLTPILWVR